MMSRQTPTKLNRLIAKRWSQLMILIVVPSVANSNKIMNSLLQGTSTFFVIKLVYNLNSQACKQCWGRVPYSEGLSVAQKAAVPRLLPCTVSLSYFILFSFSNFRNLHQLRSRALAWWAEWVIQWGTWHLHGCSKTENQSFKKWLSTSRPSGKRCWF